MNKMEKLTETGTKIKNVIEAIWISGLTVEELEAFETYVDEQETIAPLLNPSFVQKHGFEIFDKAKERINLLKPILLSRPTTTKEKVETEIATHGKPKDA